jgi:hypothetical protein
MVRCHSLLDEGMERLNDLTSLTSLEITGYNKISDAGTALPPFSSLSLL